MPARIRTERSVEGGQALGGVGEIRCFRRDPAEQVARPGRVAGPLVEVSQGVPQSEVMGLGALDLDRAAQIFKPLRLAVRGSG